MRELLEQGWGLAGIAAITGIGVLVRLLLLVYYGTLCRACGRFKTTKNRTIAYIREDLEKRAGGEQEIKNVLTYTEYRLAERRVCGFRIGSLETAVPYSILLTGVCGILISMAGMLTGSDYKTVLRMLLFGGISLAVLMILDLVSGLGERNKRVRLRLRDYIENGWVAFDEGAISLASEAEPELSQKRVSRTERRMERRSERQKKKERKAEQKERKKETKKKLSADKFKKAGKKKNGKAQEEKRRLTEELLRERRQLEARSLAEQRRKEREGSGPVEQTPAEMKGMDEPAEQTPAEMKETKGPAEQVQAEAAATATECEFTRGAELSYEALLNEFLKEYPA